ncbi:MAG: hypothetical protein R3B68_07360 [Phycisphaerales bacterium]
MSTSPKETPSVHARTPKPGAPSPVKAEAGESKRSRLPLGEAATGRHAGNDWTRWLRQQTR